MWGAIANFATDLFKGGLQNMYAENLQEDAQQFAAQQTAEARSWTERMSNTAVQRHKADLEAAGFNPLLAIAPGGSASTPSATIGSSPLASAGSIGNSQYYTQAAATAAQIDVAKAQADKLEAEAEEVRARTPRHAWDIEEIKTRIPVNQERVNQIKQEIAESAVRIEKIWAETQTQQATAVNIGQHTQVLKEQIPHLRAQVQNLKALTAQSSAATAEIKQRVAANLPAIQAALHDVERKGKELDLPDKAVRADAADSFINSFSTYLNKINPLKGLFK